MLRYFELSDTKSSKFWEIRFDEHVVTVRYGRIGTNGQTVSKPFADSESASTHVAKLVAEKLGKGYVERTEGHAGTDTKTTAAGANSEGAGRELSAADVEPPAKASPRRGRSAVIDLEAMPSQLEQLIDKDDVTNRLLAKHPHASGSMLERLSHSSDKVTRQCVVLHPNSPKEVLLRLAPQFPGDFIRNPAFDWLLLEDPDLLFRLGQGVLKNILKRPDCPATFMNWAAKCGSEQEKLALAMNPNVPPELIKKLAAAKGALGEAIKGRNAGAEQGENLEATFISEVQKALSEVSEGEIKLAWKNGTVGRHHWPWLNLRCRLTVAKLDLPVVVAGAVRRHALSLAESTDPDVRAEVARFERADAGLLDRLANDKNPAIRAAVAANIACPEATLQRLLADKSDAVRESAVINPRISCSQLEALSFDKSDSVRLNVAGARLTPRFVLERFAEHKRSTLGIIAAYRLKCFLHPASDPSSDPEALERLAASSNDSIKALIAANPSTPASLLRDFAATSKKSIAEGLAWHPHLPSDVALKAYSTLLDAAGPTSTPYLLTGSTHLRCPTEIIDKAALKLWFSACLKWSSDERSKRDLELRFNGLDEVGLMSLFRDDCWRILNSPAESIFGRMANQEGRGVLELSEGQVSSYVGSGLRPARLIGLAHPKATVAQLVKRSKSTDWVERLAIACNSSLPPNLVNIFKCDVHQVVRRAAETHTRMAP